MLIENLNRQGYREVKLHVILVGVMGTIYKDYTKKKRKENEKATQAVKATPHIN